MTGSTAPAPPAPASPPDEAAAPPASPRRRRVHRLPARPWLVDGALVFLVVGIGFALFRPEWYANQNGLDPYFYTGLSLNLSDVIDYGAGAHYFLSRWTVYGPELLLQRVLGPSVGFVAVRLLLMVLAGLGLALLRPAASRRHDLVPVAVVALFSPLFARAVFVDYSDAVAVPVGLAMVALAAKGRVGWRVSAAIGVLGAAAVVANAFALAMVAITVGGYLVRSVSRPRRLVGQVAVVVAAAAVVILVGLAFFRWRYGISNVYGPTVEFVRDKAGEPDPLKSPRLSWLAHHLWIYAPPLVLLAAAWLGLARRARFGPGELVVLGVCAVQYAFQVAYQVLLQGVTLEVGYYFSYAVPAYTAALAVVLFALFQRCSVRASALVTAAVVAALAAWRHLPELRLGSWAWYAASVAVVAALGVALSRRLPALLPLGLAAVVLGAQLAPPDPGPIPPGEKRVEAGYETLYRDGVYGVARFRSLAEFVRRMHTLDPDVRKGAGWVLASAAPQFAAAYSVHVSEPSRWLNPPMAADSPYPSRELSPFSLDRFEALGLNHVVVVCRPEELRGLLTRLDTLGMDLGAPVFDYVDADAGPATQVYVAPARARPERPDIMP